MCTLFREQELVTHQINSSMTNMCMQLVADRASRVREAATAPMEHDSVRVPEFCRGRGRGSVGEPRALFRAGATGMGCGTPPAVDVVGTTGMRSTVEVVGTTGMRSTVGGMPGHGVRAGGGMTESHGVRGRGRGVSRVAVPAAEVRSIGRGQRPRNDDDTLAQGRPVKDIRCYKCGNKGHYKSRCGRCTRCGDGGHMRHDCPHWNKNIRCWRCDKPGHVY